MDSEEDIVRRSTVKQLPKKCMTAHKDIDGNEDADIRFLERLRASTVTNLSKFGDSASAGGGQGIVLRS